MVARYGGDEFLILLEGRSEADGRELAVKLEKAVSSYDTMLIHDRLGAIRLGVSIGVAAFPDHGHDCAALISAADSDMYRNKTERKLKRMMAPNADSDDKDEELRRAA